MPKRIDDNHSEIVKDLRAIGATVQSLAALGRGAPDIACGIFGRNYFFEIKNPNMPPSKRALTEAEIVWHETWRGQVNIIHSLDDALAVINAA